MSSDINVSVKAQYMAGQSQPEKDKYTFSYQVTITNQGEEAAKLISRHWIITDGNGARKEVKGLGVIGEQPTIAPGEDYQYTSFSVLDTRVGTMEGSYQMEQADGTLFDAPIPPFLLAVPGTIN